MSDADDRNSLDPLIHEHSRLLIVAVLNECDAADFNFLLTTTKLSRGNLSAHMARLVEARYVEEKKDFVNRRPHTEYRLAAKGRKSFAHYRKAWRRLVGPI
jgi:DNA-binding MarR family transcriptional regulator